MRRKLLFILTFVLLLSGCTTSARVVEKEEDNKIVEEVSKDTSNKSKEQEESKKETVKEQKPVEKVKKEESKKETEREEPKKEVQPKETKKEEVKKEVQPKETKKEEPKKDVQPKVTKANTKKKEVKEQPVKKEELKQSEIKKGPKVVAKKETEPVVKETSKPVVKKETKLETKESTKPVVKKESRPIVKKETKPVVKEETKPELKPTPKPQPKPEPKPITYPANSITVGDSTITWVYWKNVVGYTNWNKDDVGPATSLQNAIDKERDKWVNIMTKNNLFSINGTKNLWIASHNYNTPGKQVYHIPQSIIVTDQYGVSAKYKLIDRAKTYDFIGTGTYGKNDVFVQTCLPDGKDVMHFTLVEILK